MFDIGELFIQCNTNSCCEHITCGVNVNIYMGVSVYWPVFVLYVFFVCVISIKVLAKKFIMCQTSVNLTPSCTKDTAKSYSARLDMCRSIMLLSKITRQVLDDHLFSQGNKKSRMEDVGWDGKKIKKREAIWGVFIK